MKARARSNPGSIRKNSRGSRSLGGSPWSGETNRQSVAGPVGREQPLGSMSSPCSVRTPVSTPKHFHSPLTRSLPATPVTQKQASFSSQSPIRTPSRVPRNSYRRQFETIQETMETSQMSRSCSKVPQKKHVIRVSHMDLLDQNGEADEFMSLKLEQYEPSPWRPSSSMSDFGASFHSGPPLSEQTAGMARSSSALRMCQLRDEYGSPRRFRSPTRTPPPGQRMIKSMSTQSTPSHRRNFHHEEWRPPVMAEMETSSTVKRSATMTAIPQAQRRHDILVGSKTHELWSHPMECLKLTVRELSHIRQVFSRAEIEKFHSQNQTKLYELLSKEQICLNCKIQRFNWMSWAYPCDICAAKVCKKCLRKVASPVDEVQEAAAYMLYPLDTPENQVNWDEGGKKLSVCDSCVELLSHLVENARKALEARGRQSMVSRKTLYPTHQ